MGCLPRGIANLHWCTSLPIWIATDCEYDKLTSVSKPNPVSCIDNVDCKLPHISVHRCGPDTNYCGSRVCCICKSDANRCIDVDLMHTDVHQCRSGTHWYGSDAYQWGSNQCLLMWIWCTKSDAHRCGSDAHWSGSDTRRCGSDAHQCGSEIPRRSPKYFHNSCSSISSFNTSCDIILKIKRIKVCIKAQ